MSADLNDDNLSQITCWICGNCGYGNSASATICGGCQFDRTAADAEWRIRSHIYKEIHESAWHCPTCGNVNGTTICLVCRRARPPEALELSKVFVDVPMKRRVELHEVAQVIHLVTNRPNSRHRPRGGDLEGRFDLWFDGGAVKHQTGHSNYVLNDGTRVMEHVLRYFALTIRFPDGETVKVTQEERRKDLEQT